MNSRCIFGALTLTAYDVIHTSSNNAAQSIIVVIVIIVDVRQQIQRLSGSTTIKMTYGWADSHSIKWFDITPENCQTSHISGIKHALDSLRSSAMQSIAMDPSYSEAS